jgi:siroheme decarboxylase
MIDGKARDVARLIQGDLPLVRRPFQAIADQTGLREQDVLNAISDMMARGFVRKFGAIVRHQKAGFTRNLMALWSVPEDRCEAVGLLLASYPEITHCYERSPAFEGKYNLFTMIHLRGHDEETFMETLKKATGVADCRLLFSEEEFKKISMEYF